MCCSPCPTNARRSGMIPCCSRSFVGLRGTLRQTQGPSSVQAARAVQVLWMTVGARVTLTWATPVQNRLFQPLSRYDPPVTGARASCPRTSRHLPLFDRIAKNTVCDGLSEVEGRMPSLPGTPTTPVPNQFLTWTAVTKRRGPVLTLRNDFQENQVLSHPRSSLPIYPGQQWTWADRNVRPTLTPAS